MKKVLVGAPCSDRHGYVLDEYIENIKNFTHPCDILLVDTTPKNDKYYNRIKKIKGVKVLRYRWDSKKEHIILCLAKAREKIRQYAIKHGYDYLFCLDQDTIPPRDGVEKLISYDKDQVGFVVHVYHKPFPLKPAVFHSGFIVAGYGLDYYKWKEIADYKRNARKWIKGESNGWKPDDSKFPYLKKVYANALGCLLIKRKVLEKTKFVAHPSFRMGEDLWYYAYADDKGFEAWSDFSVRATHKNSHWSNIFREELKNQGKFKWYFVHGWDIPGKKLRVVQPKHDRRSVKETLQTIERK